MERNWQAWSELGGVDRERDPARNVGTRALRTGFSQQTTAPPTPARATRTALEHKGVMRFVKVTDDSLARLPYAKVMLYTA